MTFSQSIRHVYSNYFNFSDRASRSEYWYFVLFMSIVYLALALLSLLTGGSMEVSLSQGDPVVGQYGEMKMMDLITFHHSGVYNMISSIFGLATLIPWLALNVRRLHDAGNGGGWILMFFVPVIGQIWYLILMLLPSNEGMNRFGSMPE